MAASKTPKKPSGREGPTGGLAGIVEREIRTRFAAVADAESAASQRAYMKSALSFHGVSTAEMRAAGRAALEAHALDHDGLVAVVDGLFDSEWFDVRSAGLAMLERKVRLLGGSDLPFLIGLVRRAGCWAHVDWIATSMIGKVVEREGLARSVTPGWAVDADFWVRRTALLTLLMPLRKGEGDFALFSELAGPMVVEKEFFIRKAIGWVLRETSKKRPALAFEFLKAHRERVSGLTLREGAKYLPDEMRAGLGLAPTGAGSAPKTKTK
ncbi:MAG: DNA alkylation repair protein [Polyangiaceae bacterium]